MADLLNSQRRLFKATNVPIKNVPLEESDVQSRRRRTSEASRCSRRLTSLTHDPAVHELAVTNGNTKSPLLDVISGFSSDRTPFALQKYGPTLARASFDDLRDRASARRTTKQCSDGSTSRPRQGRPS